MSNGNSKLQPSESVSMLTNLFINLCAINAFRMHLVQMDEEQKQGVIASILGQWEKECRGIFDSSFLRMNEQLKSVPAADRLQSSMQVDKIREQFEFDLLSAKMNLTAIF